MSKQFRRVVTGHNERGQAIIQSDAPPTRVKTLSDGAGPTFYEVWNTRESPTLIDKSSGEPPEDGIVLAPPRNGTRIRVLDIPPETEDMERVDAAQARALFAEIGAAGASTHSAGTARHPHMHRTETVDYGIILEGEITLLVDIGEVIVRAGDIVVQRGTNHGWANRSGKNCRIAFILIDGKFVDGLA
jgi:mannose-6-phosphate isomerase-like protein (cupin superfamily)